MSDFTCTLAVAALLAAPALAQERLDPSRLYPITVPVRDAGTVDVTTGRWTRGASGAKALGVRIYDNTCSWQTQAYYAGFDWCEDNYDEGRIPSPGAPNAPAGASAVNVLRSIEVSYCTVMGPLQGSGGYDMDLAFFDKLNGDCVGNVPPTPPPVSSTASAYLPLAGLGLPGSTAFPFLACWLVTLDVSNAGVFLASDGDGTYDGSAAEDEFVWMQRQNSTNLGITLPIPPDGFVIAGEPASAPFGACTYSIPCGVGSFFGTSCGTGLDTFDGSWINVDGIGVGASGVVPGCVNSVAQYGFGTNCYFFGGYPTNPFASYWLVLEAEPAGDCAIAYCPQAKPTSVPGCTTVLELSDCTLASGEWRGVNIPRDAGVGAGTSLGVFVYTHGVGIGQSSFSAVVPFGTLCLSGFERSAPACAPALLPNAQPGVCNPGPMSTAVDCNGGALGIQVGEDVNVQLWYRDPTAANPGNANLSSAVFYTVQ